MTYTVQESRLQQQYHTGWPVNLVSTLLCFFFASFHHSVRISAVFKKENGFFVFHVSSHHDYIFCLLHDGKRLKITTPAGHSSEFHKSLGSFLYYSLAP